jgi:hypothetical protein
VKLATLKRQFEDGLATAGGMRRAEELKRVA